MRNNVFLDNVKEQLARLGCPRSLMLQHLRELAEHYEDARLDELAHGSTEDQAAANAESRLGSPQRIASELMAVSRQTHWAGRHPILSFCVLTPVVGLISFAILMVAGIEAGDMFVSRTQLNALANDGPALAWIGRGILALFCATVLMTAMVFSKVARHSGCGWKWVFIVCGVCAAEGYCVRPVLAPHAFSISVAIGYGFTPNWICMLLPLLFAGAAYWRSVRLDRVPGLARTGMLLLVGSALAFSSAGCASSHKPKPELHRGWIGGEYSVVRRVQTVLSQTNAPEDAQTAKKFQKNGLLILALATNTPARLCGMREGDLLLEVNHSQVASLKKLHCQIDAAKPGDLLQVSAVRDGVPIEFAVPVGQETFQKRHSLSLGLFLSPLSFGSQPNVSLIALGYCGSNNSRQEKDSVYNKYMSSVSKKFEPENSGWMTWVGPVAVGGSETVVKQEPFSADKSQSAAGLH